jgi:5-methylcytosine-specific restriction protein A
MYLFKTSGTTIDSVIKNQKHAFTGAPRDWYAGEIVLVSKNKENLSIGEKQIRYIMRIENIREIRPGEAEMYWPGNEGRWKYLIECYDTIKLDRPFDLADILKESAKKFQPIMTFKRIDNSDEQLIVNYIENYLSLPPIQEEIMAVKAELNRLNQEFESSSSTKKETISKSIERNPRIISLMKRFNSNNKCQVCNTDNFVKKNGEHYSEVHHIVSLSKGGSQATDNCLVVCPTCHRKMHYASVGLEPVDEKKIIIAINGEKFQVTRNRISGSDLIG